MDVFALRDQLIGDYTDYIQSFINIRDSRIQQYMDPEFRSDLLWPEPLLQLNPSFEPGPWIDDLVDRQVLYSLCRQIFRIKPEDKPDNHLPPKNSLLSQHSAAARGQRWR
ncbi:MAG: hypothetical protein HC875_37590 [Anaerolineales bacterium]|nr:hypothetical protein [Anaerolineales bacterium]